MIKKQFIIPSRIGDLELDNIPFPDNIEVKIFITPKIKLSEMSFNKIRELRKSIKGNISKEFDYFDF
ncbi:MAG: hypothetical protein U9R23_02890 [Candidatus Cloacimonadota bacterium]|nr:hypothetical protein [Candidatus Cloacimonadota bacterium]